MRGITAFFAFVVAAATTVFALPEPPCCGQAGCSQPCPPACPTGCLDDATAKKLAATWLYFGVNIDRTLALELLAPNFTYYSDSENLVGLSGVSYDSSMKAQHLTEEQVCQPNWPTRIYQRLQFHPRYAN